LNFDTRLAFVGGFATMEMVPVVDSQIILRSRVGKMVGGIDRMTGNTFLNGYDKDDADRSPVSSAELQCKPATPIFLMEADMLVTTPVATAIAVMIVSGNTGQ
jgi:hypothetical protein